MLSIILIGSPIDAIVAAIAVLGILLASWRPAMARLHWPDEARTSGADSSEDSVSPFGSRLSSHPISELPVREVLVAQMEADRVGVVGALAFADLDRLTAFDPALAERALARLAERLRRMLKPHRCVSQVDRTQVAVWFARTEYAAAQAELNAITYALGDVLDLGNQSLTPRIEVRLAQFDASKGVASATFLTRTLASFSLPMVPAATIEGNSADDLEIARDRYALEQDLRLAITRRELRLAFQPLVDAGQGRIDGAEALLRWDHIERGAVPPSRFVPIMEHAGLAGELGMWVLNAAVREAREWTHQGLRDLRVAVNVSALQLAGDDLPMMVQRTLERHGLSAAALEIELTESLAMTDAERCRSIFRNLRTIGVKLAVDDFGTGYSGFSSLRALAFDKIKIDREFVTDVDRRRDSQAICQSIVALGRGLGIRVLAEGVERREEYQWLRRNGCQHFQGYYFGRPMDGTTFAACVRDTARLSELLRLTDDLPRIEKRLRA